MTLKVNINLLQDNNGVAGEPISQDKISVNDSFFVEIKVADVRENAAGVIGLALDLEWDASVLEALDTEVTNTITSSLPVNPQGTIDNENGLIDNLGAGAIPNFNLGSPIGINEPERFALLHFKGELATDNPIPLTVTVSDPRTVAFADGKPFDGETDIEVQTLAVTPENNAPILENPLADVTATEDSEFSLTIPDNTFNDVDAGDTLTYSATLEDGSELPDWLSFDAATKTFSGMPANNHVGNLNIKVTVTDNSGETKSDVFVLTVENVDDAPVVSNEIADVTVDEDADNSVIDLSNIFSDIDNDNNAIVKTVVANSNESLVTANIEGNNLTLDYLDHQSGTAEITIQGESNGKTVEETFTVTVNPVDDAPIIQNAIADVTVDEDADNSVIDLSNIFSDIDNDNNAIVKTVVANSNESLVTANIEGNNLTLDYLDHQSGTAEITIQGESNGKTVEETLTVTVNPVDDLPIVSNEIEDITVDKNAVNQILDLSNVFSDADGDEITLAVKDNTNDSLVTTTLDGNNLTLDFLDDQFGSAEITIEATANGETVEDTFIVTVNDVTPENTPPTLENPLGDVTATEDSEFSLIIPENTFNDVDAGDTLTYSATVEDGSELPSWLTFDAPTKTFNGTPTNSDVGVLDIKVTATDNSGEIISDSFVLTVENVNDAPTLENALADITTTEDSELSLTIPENTFNDVDAGDTLTYSATLEDGSELPSWLTFDAPTRTFNGTPTNSDVGTLDIKVTATDGVGEAKSDSFVLTVENANLPTENGLISIADSSGNPDDATIQFTTPLSQFHDGVSDRDLVRPSYPDTQQYIDITNTGDGSLSISEIRLNAPGVTAELPTEDILLNTNETQRIQLTYAPGESNENFSIDDGLTIISNAANTPEMSVSLSGKSTFDSDINYDGLVSFGDLGPLNANWGRENTDANWNPTADINGDGLVNPDDFEILNQQWNFELTFI